MFNFKISKNSPLTHLVLFAAAFMIGPTTSAFAAMSLGSIFCNAVVNARPMGVVFQWIGYVAGVLGIVTGIHHLRLHADSPQNHKLTTPLALIIGGASLLVLPATASALINSVYGTRTGAAGNLSCEAGAIAGGEGLDAMLIGFISNIKDPLKQVCSISAILAGLYMIVRGLMKGSKYGTDPKTHSMHSVLVYLGFGALLITIGENLNMMLGSLFGSGAAIQGANVINWGHLSALIGGKGVSQRFIDAVNAALVFVQLIGCIAFVRGWLIMKKVVEGSQNVTLAQGMTHILGGVAAINIYQFLIAMDYTFGTNLIS